MCGIGREIGAGDMGLRVTSRDAGETLWAVVGEEGRKP